ncbi:hypothetical protein [Rhodococcus tukisamuensis]|uniref:Aldehyde dehydrogenase (NAD+) n=1 Tax=Rhodococcus tukisamuensis TaxID=168276 RepID=A0A1G6U6R5_9NOCA|nr:hypothetical protein [Rhodococcus tukisamuensis]SDD37058.1 aldehyde dehydrogenase (NAD+) [Rhodococcus tukisamuensis]
MRSTTSALVSTPTGGLDYMAPQLPFGNGASGMRTYNGRSGFGTFSHRKAVLLKQFKPDPRFTYPPYTDRAVKLIRRMYRA